MLHLYSVPWGLEGDEEETLNVDDKKSNQNTMKQVVYWVYKLGGKSWAQKSLIYGTLPCFHGNLILSGIITLSLSFLISFSVFIDVFKFLGTNIVFLHLFIPLVPFLFCFNFAIIGKNDIFTSWNSHEIQTGGFNMMDVLEFMTF